MPKAKKKPVKRIVIEIYDDYSDEFGDPLENIQIVLEMIEGLGDYTVKEEKV